MHPIIDLINNLSASIKREAADAVGARKGLAYLSHGADGYALSAGRIHIPIPAAAVSQSIRDAMSGLGEHGSLAIQAQIPYLGSLIAGSHCDVEPYQHIVNGEHRTGHNVTLRHNDKTQPVDYLTTAIPSPWASHASSPTQTAYAPIDVMAQVATARDTELASAVLACVCVREREGQKPRIVATNGKVLLEHTNHAACIGTTDQDTLWPIESIQLVQAIRKAATKGAGMPVSVLTDASRSQAYVVVEGIGRVAKVQLTNPTDYRYPPYEQAMLATGYEDRIPLGLAARCGAYLVPKTASKDRTHPVAITPYGASYRTGEYHASVQHTTSPDDPTANWQSTVDNAYLQTVAKVLPADAMITHDGIHYHGYVIKSGNWRALIMPVMGIDANIQPDCPHIDDVAPAKGKRKAAAAPRKPVDPIRQAAQQALRMLVNGDAQTARLILAKALKA